MFFILISINIISANPIPVYPDPEPVYYGSSGFSKLDIFWILGIFLLDFFMDILIVYGGITLLYQFNLINKDYLFDFSKLRFFLSVFVIALVGLISELFLGPWIIGFAVALFIIFLSFVFVSRFLFTLNWINSVRLGLIAIIINIIFWIIVFSL
jgi:hypothetical protein